MALMATWILRAPKSSWESSCHLKVCRKVKVFPQFFHKAPSLSILRFRFHFFFVLEAVFQMCCDDNCQDVLYNLGAAQWHHETLGGKHIRTCLQGRMIERFFVERCCWSFWLRYHTYVVEYTIIYMLHVACVCIYDICLFIIKEYNTWSFMLIYDSMLAVFAQLINIRIYIYICVCVHMPHGWHGVDLLNLWV